MSSILRQTGCEGMDCWEDVAATEDGKFHMSPTYEPVKVVFYVCIQSKLERKGGMWSHLEVLFVFQTRLVIRLICLTPSLKKRL